MADLIYGLYEAKRKDCKLYRKVLYPKLDNEGGGEQVIVSSFLFPLIHFEYEYKDKKKIDFITYIFFFVLNFLKTVYRIIITCKKYKMYLFKYKGKIIHTSIVMGKCFKFPFMMKGDIQIGPCWTSPLYRGSGIYPYIISKIMEKELESENHKAFVFVLDSNIASWHGVLKAGFKKTSYVKLTKFKKLVIL